MPGAITPPMYSRRAPTASEVVAVPKVDDDARPAGETGDGQPSTMRSAPSSLGLSISTGPVRTPGPTTTVGASGWCGRASSRIPWSTAGTVEQIEIPAPTR